MNNKKKVKKPKDKIRKNYKPIKYKVAMVASLLIGVIGLSMILPNITGNVISDITKNNSSWIGLILLFVGMIGFFVANREMRGETGKPLEILVVDDKEENLGMVKHQIAKQREYETLEDFTKKQNNFYLHFLENNFMGDIYRANSHFKRFQEQNPELEQNLTRAIGQAVKSKSEPELPYEQLFEAYKIMSKLVFVDDERVTKNGESDSFFLCG